MSIFPDGTFPGRGIPDITALSAHIPGLEAPKSGRAEYVQTEGVPLGETGVTEVGTVEADRVTSVDANLEEEPDELVYAVHTTPEVGVGEVDIEFEVIEPADEAVSSDVEIGLITEDEL